MSKTLLAVFMILHLCGWSCSYHSTFQWAQVKPNRVFTLLPLAVILRQWESNQERFPLATLQCIFSHQSQWVLYGQHYNSVYFMCVREERIYESPFLPFLLTLSISLYLMHPILLTASRSVCSTFLKSRVQSLAFSPNCHLHCVSASYSSPGSFSG